MTYILKPRKNLNEQTGCSHRPKNKKISITGQKQWWCQHSKGARSFRGQKIIQPGHPDALFSYKMLTTFFLFVGLKTQAANAVSPLK